MAARGFTTPKRDVPLNSAQPAVSKGFNRQQFGARRKEKVTGTDELYPRPRPNPFTNSYANGYDIGMTDGVPLLGMNNPADFWAGVEDGRADKRDLDRTGSSNA